MKANQSPPQTTPQVEQNLSQVKSKKESIFSGILASRPFRTTSMSINENLSQEAVNAPQRSQTMIISKVVSIEIEEKSKLEGTNEIKEEESLK